MNRIISINVSAAAGAICLLLAAGCGRDDVKVYHIDTNQVAAAPAPPAPAMTMPDEAPAPDNGAQPKMKYTVPAGWVEKKPTQLRVASFEITEGAKLADVSVIPLGGMSGGDVANVNRWRGQVGLEAQEEAVMKKSSEPVQIAGKPGELYDIAGTAPGNGDQMRILGAILHGDDAVWYFKMTGNAALVEKQKPNFIAFVKSVDFNKLAPPSSMDLNKLPPSHPQIPGLGAATSPAEVMDSPDKPKWEVPADWQPGELAQFLIARYIVKGSGDSSAMVNVSELAGEGGGLLSNVNRWRAQLGQKPTTEDDVAKMPTIDTAGTKATVVDITGTDPRSNKPARLIGVVLPLNGQSWFYKMMGDADVVGQQKAAFLKFVQSAKYPDVH